MVQEIVAMLNSENGTKRQSALRLLIRFAEHSELPYPVDRACLRTRIKTPVFIHFMTYLSGIVRLGQERTLSSEW
jgi:hypothetical protein